MSREEDLWELENKEIQELLKICHPKIDHQKSKPTNSFMPSDFVFKNSNFYGSKEKYVEIKKKKALLNQIDIINFHLHYRVQKALQKANGLNSEYSNENWENSISEMLNSLPIEEIKSTVSSVENIGNQIQDYADTLKNQNKPNLYSDEQYQNLNRNYLSLLRAEPELYPAKDAHD
ncbi:hypothetical protein TRFO_39671 [Tritrichomonas foetus]|uniref:Uncharacterized protein n=1 Tax=Tritrichomonas foetus TaxID=1144522 RepID=A0A1J4JA59_9EUKA|nr:hypothetical protein TRFO_39671 [Tritrichomonas foetus]|eukprot:OHS94140.1 hypothetical protein TRFO_39671 [Tritrichomonas foetus]